MARRNLIRVDLLAVDAYEIAIGNEHCPIGNPTTTRAKQQDFWQRVGKGLRAILSACTDDVRSRVGCIDDLNELWEALKTKYDTRLL